MKTLGVFLLFFVLTGCDFVNQQAVAGFRQFFPNATIVPQRGGLEIETNVHAGIGRQLCIELFQAFAQKPDFTRLVEGLRVANYRFLAINFGEHTIIWLPSQREGFRVVTRAESNTPYWQQAPLLPLVGVAPMQQQDMRPQALPGGAVAVPRPDGGRDVYGPDGTLRARYDTTGKRID